MRTGYKPFDLGGLSFGRIPECGSKSKCLPWTTAGAFIFHHEAPALRGCPAVGVEAPDHCQGVRVLTAMGHLGPFQLDVGRGLKPELTAGSLVVTDNLSRDTAATVRRHRGGQCAAAVPAALRARPQSDRDGLFTAQSALTQSCRAHPRGPQDGHLPNHRYHHARSRRQSPRRHRA